MRGKVPIVPVADPGITIIGQQHRGQRAWRRVGSVAGDAVQLGLDNDAVRRRRYGGSGAGEVGLNVGGGGVDQLVIAGLVYRPGVHLVGFAGGPGVGGQLPPGGAWAQRAVREHIVDGVIDGPGGAVHAPVFAYVYCARQFLHTHKHVFYHAVGPVVGAAGYLTVGAYIPAVVRVGYGGCGKRNIIDERCLEPVTFRIRGQIASVSLDAENSSVVAGKHGGVYSPGPIIVRRRGAQRLGSRVPVARPVPIPAIGIAGNIEIEIVYQ